MTVSIIPAIPPIKTERLELASMNLEFLQALACGDRAGASAASGLEVPPGFSLSGQIWVERRIHLLRENPAQHEWMYRAIVRKSDRELLGYISFHHMAPDPDLSEYSPFGAELGYTIEASHRQKGYAKESALALMNWAHRKHGVQTFVLSISPANIPSLKMAESMHFVKSSERMDETDGLEYTFVKKLMDSA